MAEAAAPWPFHKKFRQGETVTASPTLCSHSDRLPLSMKHEFLFTENRRIGYFSGLGNFRQTAENQGKRQKTGDRAQALFSWNFIPFPNGGNSGPVAGSSNAGPQPATLGTVMFTRSREWEAFQHVSFLAVSLE